MKEFTLVKKFEFNMSCIHKVKCLYNRSFGDCYKKYYHMFHYTCLYDVSFSNISNNEIIKLTISDKSTSLYELNKKNLKNFQKMVF